MLCLFLKLISLVLQLIINGIAFVLLPIYLYLLTNLRMGWNKLPEVKPIKNGTVYTKVSVLIAARNEERNIAETIESILHQQFPTELMELIVVDDHSTDRTASIIASYENQGVQLLQLNESAKLNSYKKMAISKAIDIASGELIVATDADCTMGPHWLSTIVGWYEERNDVFISSPVVYYREKSYFERLQTLEFLYLIGLGASTIGLKRPSTCNGANLAYRRDVFFELGGFQGIDDLASGDDELFLHKVAQKYPDRIGFCKAEEAIVYTEAKENLKEFIRQRKRWASKSTKYKNKQIVMLGVLIWLFNTSLLLCAGIAFFSWGGWFCFLCLFALKMLGECYFTLPITRFAKRSALLWSMPLLSMLHIVYMVYIGIAGNTGKYDWKGRNVR